MNVLYHLAWDTAAYPPVSMLRTALQLVPEEGIIRQVRAQAEAFAELALSGSSSIAPPGPSPLPMTFPL